MWHLRFSRVTGLPNSLWFRYCSANLTLSSHSRRASGRPVGSAMRNKVGSLICRCENFQNIRITHRSVIIGDVVKKLTHVLTAPAE